MAKAQEKVSKHMKTAQERIDRRMEKMEERIGRHMERAQERIPKYMEKAQGKAGEQGEEINERMSEYIQGTHEHMSQSIEQAREAMEEQKGVVAQGEGRQESHNPLVIQKDTKNHKNINRSRGKAFHRSFSPEDLWKVKALYKAIRKVGRFDFIDVKDSEGNRISIRFV